MGDSIEHTFGSCKCWAGATSSVPVEVAWALLSTPGRWPAWAPHIRRVSREDGAPPPGELAVGQILRIHGPAPVAVRAHITRVDALQRWDSPSGRGAVADRLPLAASAVARLALLAASDHAATQAADRLAPPPEV